MNAIHLNSFRHMLYEQKGGYLLLPVLIMIILGLLAFAIPLLEQHVPAIAACAKKVSWLAPSDPTMAQILLAAIAGSCITVVSVVYSVLLIALTFASIQFSPRILTSFQKDRVSQGTLGIFNGTFAYCLILLPHLHTGSRANVPTLSLAFALLLATACLFYLIYFIQHIALFIQANYIVDRIAKETESVLRSMFGQPMKDFPLPEEPLVEPATGIAVTSIKSGYIQYIDESKLLDLAIKDDVSFHIHRGVGQFIPAGVRCITIDPVSKDLDRLKREVTGCFQIGAWRTMEDDVEFGTLQLVDIALKAISPAVNDPSTAISCVDHLSSILILAATLKPPVSRLVDANGKLRITRRQPSFPRLLEIAYNQIRPYGKGDMAVSLRLMRALQDISGLTNYGPYLAAIRLQAQRVVTACAGSFAEEDCVELFERLAAIETRQAEP